MSSELSNLSELFLAIQERVASTVTSDFRTSLTSLLVLSIDEALLELKAGANPEEFQELTILNLLMKGTEAGYYPQELHTFVRSLKRTIDDDDDA